MRKPLHSCITLTCFVLLQLVAPSTGICQFEEENFILHTRKDGLIHDYITGIVQDEKGYIWISTAHGLSRYDGSEYFPISLKQFKCYDEYGDIGRMKYFGKNEIGIITGRGGYSFNSQTLAYQAYIAPPLFGTIQSFNKCRDIEKTNNGQYITSTGSGLYVFDKGGKIILRKDGITEKERGQNWFQFGGPIEKLQGGLILQENRQNNTIYDPATNSITDLTDPNGQSVLRSILISKTQSLIRPRFYKDPYYANGILVFNRDSNSLDIIHDIRKPHVSQSLPLPFNVKNEVNWESNLCFVNDSVFTITLSNNGFYAFHYNKRNGSITLDPRRHLPNHRIVVMFSDRNNELWVGTNKGLLRPGRRFQQARSYDLQKNSGGDHRMWIDAIWAEPDAIYVGSTYGIQLLDPETKLLKGKLDFSSVDSNCNRIVSITASPMHADTLWVGTWGGMLWLNKKNFRFGRLKGIDYPAELDKGPVIYTFTDSRKNYWFRLIRYNRVAYYDQALKKFFIVSQETAGKMFSISLCFGIGEDRSGNIWFGGDGICRWNPSTGLCDTLIKNIKGLNTEYINYHIFDTDEQRNIWMTTAAGIMRWDPVSNKQQLFTTKDGLPDNIGIAYPSPDKNHLFMHTYKGMGWLDKRTGKTVAFNEKDGIPEAVNTSMSNFFNKYRNEYLFSYNSSLLVFPGNFKKFSPPPQSLNISMLHIYHDSTIFHPDELTVLSPGQNDIGICFNAVNFYDPENHAFAYRLYSDEHSPWIGTGGQSTIYLNNLSPGNYKLQVKLMALNKRWPDVIREIQLVINPPFWKRTWFFILAALAVAAIVFTIYWRRVKQIRQRANVDKLLAQTEMKALHAQMNPHFVFNCLNSINEMILLKENTQASHYLSKFAHLIRTTLDHSTKEWVSLKQTIDYLQRYIELEKIRRADFHFIVDIEKGINENETFLPPMLIQPLLENAIWHGKTKGVPLEIRTSFYKDENHLLCVVSDNGIGIEESRNKRNGEKPHKSIGISNIEQRIRLLNEKYNLHSALIVEDRKGGLQTGTIATLRLPLKTSDV